MNIFRSGRSAAGKEGHGKTKCEHTQSDLLNFSFEVTSTSTYFTTWSAAWITVSVTEISQSGQLLVFNYWKITLNCWKLCFYLSLHSQWTYSLTFDLALTFPLLEPYSKWTSLFSLCSDTDQWKLTKVIKCYGDCHLWENHPHLQVIYVFQVCTNASFKSPSTNITT